LTAYLKGSDVHICLENLFTHTQTCSQLLSLIERAGNDNLGICLDTGHLNLADRDQAAFIRQAGTYLRALHITDNQEKMDEHILPFARGTVDWLTVVRSLDKIHYGGLFNYEIPGENKAPLSIRLAKLDYIKEMTRCLFAEAGLTPLE
jgi:sugar phosphate isomerase/epimerase